MRRFLVYRNYWKIPLNNATLLIMNTQSLIKILLSILETEPATKVEFGRARTKVCAELRVSQPPNRELLRAYHNLLTSKKITPDKQIEQFLRKAQVRSLSGIAVVTALVKPYACPGKCVYCPTEARMPKSYLASEPAAARALRLDFSPYEQMRRRIEMLEKNGHPTDKIEYIVKGGTWNAYPLQYQYWFILESFRAANEISQKTQPPPSGGVPPKAGKTKKHRKHLNENTPLEELQAALEKEQRKNEKAKHRIIGITLETRPDAISPKTIYHMRLQGCTRVELGLQAPDDRILKLIKRGHTVQQFRDAMHLLRSAGFKVDLHFMPDLPGTTPENDVEMYKQLFSDDGLKPDMVKIYPNTVIPSAELYQWYLDGRYKPYGDENLFNALLQMKLATPRYCRISRLIRDIPAHEIAAGNKITNLREALMAELKKRGQLCVCLRCREIGRQEKTLQLYNPAFGRDPAYGGGFTTLQLFTESYETTGGTEYFLSLEDTERIAVYAFLRLRLPHTPPSDRLLKFLPEIRDCAFIRELHTYGQQLHVGERDKSAAQHHGLGKRLVKESEKIAKKHGFKKMAVISGVGVRGYYRKLGYRKAGTYMVKNLCFC